MADPRTRLHALEAELGKAEEELFVLESAKNAGLEFTEDEGARHGELPGIIANLKREISNEQRGLGLDP